MTLLNQIAKYSDLNPYRMIHYLTRIVYYLNRIVDAIGKLRMNLSLPITVWITTTKCAWRTVPTRAAEVSALRRTTLGTAGIKSAVSWVHGQSHRLNC